MFKLENGLPYGATRPPPRPMNEMMSQYNPFSTSSIIGIDAPAPLQTVSPVTDSTAISPPMAPSPVLVSGDSTTRYHTDTTAADHLITNGLAQTKLSGCDHVDDMDNPGTTTELTVTTLKPCVTPVSVTDDDKLNDGNKSEDEEDLEGKKKGKPMHSGKEYGIIIVRFILLNAGNIMS